MFDRNLRSVLAEDLAHMPAVALLGPRQVGKTTLAQILGQGRDAHYLDLESPADQARLEDAQFYFEENRDRLIILDEVQRMPGLFDTLRGQIDRNRARGQRAGQFLLLGSASRALLQQSESLAGRVAYQELFPLSVTEAGPQTDLWVKGGFPDAFSAPAKRSMAWRLDFIRTYLERDIPMFGSRVPATTLRRFWTMLAHTQGQPFNASKIGANFGVSGQAASRYLDLMVDLMLVRRLPPWFANVGKRLVKRPKVYVRDSGILHALLNLPDLDAVLGHPVMGGSWEGFAIENIAAHAPKGAELYFYRTSGGAEVDLVIDFGTELWAVEIKHGLTPRPSRGFYEACADLNPARKLIVYSGAERFKVKADVEVMSLSHLCGMLGAGL